MIVTTESGTEYEFREKEVRRIGRNFMRREGEWVKLQAPVFPRLGFPMTMLLEPLGMGFATLRTTTPVTNIQEGSKNAV